MKHFNSTFSSLLWLSCACWLSAQEPTSPTAKETKEHSITTELKKQTLWGQSPLDPKAPKPNIVFILVDDMGIGDLGISHQNQRAKEGKPALQTPTLDSLAKSGDFLTQHYCPAPVCAPSRASLYLGLHQGHSNVRDGQFDKALANELTIGKVLQSANYTTALIGKWGLSGPTKRPLAHPSQRGFHYFFGMLGHLSGHFHYPNSIRILDNRGEMTGVFDMYDDITPNTDKAYSTDLTTAQGKKFLKEITEINKSTEQKQPFFLMLAYTAPHAALEVPTCEYPANKGLKGGVQWLGNYDNPKNPIINTAVGKQDSYIYPDFANATWDHDKNANTPPVKWPAFATRHASMIKRIDEGVADIVQTLKDLNLYENTLIVFTSDNGPCMEGGAYGKHKFLPNFFTSFGEHEGIKRDMWEGGLRIPAIVHWPSKIEGKLLHNEISQFQDWLPTFAELAGAPIPAATDGISLAPLLQGKPTERNQVIYSELYSDNITPDLPEFAEWRRKHIREQMQMIRIGDFKGIRLNIKDGNAPFDIYNVKDDPKELKNLKDSRPDLQELFQTETLRRRVANASAPRPYDNCCIPALAPSKEKHTPTLRIKKGNFAYLPEIPLTEPALPLKTKLGSEPQAIRIDTIINVPQDGKYSFNLHSNVPAMLRIHRCIVANSDMQPIGTEVTGTVCLKAGEHPVTIYMRSTQNQQPRIKLNWLSDVMPVKRMPLIQ